MDAHEANAYFAAKAEEYGISVPYVFVNDSVVVLSELFANFDAILEKVREDVPDCRECRESDE